MESTFSFNISESFQIELSKSLMGWLVIYAYTGSILAGTGQLFVMNIIEGTSKSPSNLKIQGFYSLE